jgi:hypothetical protein
VTVYRFVTCGTIEEKMYRRQIFKDGLCRTAMAQVNVARHFAKDELRDLFRVGDFDASETLRLLESEPVSELGATDSVDALGMVVGVSRHDDAARREQQVDPEFARAVAQQPLAPPRATPARTPAAAKPRSKPARAPQLEPPAPEPPVMALSSSSDEEEAEEDVVKPAGRRQLVRAISSSSEAESGTESEMGAPEGSSYSASAHASFVADDTDPGDQPVASPAAAAAPLCCDEHRVSVRYSYASFCGLSTSTVPPFLICIGLNPSCRLYWPDDIIFLVLLFSYP